MTGDAPPLDGDADKPELRRRFRAARAAVPASRRRLAALRCARQVRALARRLRARHVGAYLHVGSEMPTDKVIRALQADGIAVYLPRVRPAGQLVFTPLRGAALRRGAFGIREPAGRRRIAPRRLDLLLVPLVAFDACGNRLGAGGGFYDRLLARLPAHRPLRAGLAFSVQRADRLPREPHDQPLHRVITERGTLRCRQHHPEF